MECAIKQQSQNHQLHVYDKLFALGLEGSFLSDICPVADKNEWNRCPFRQPQS